VLFSLFVASAAVIDLPFCKLSHRGGTAVCLTNRFISYSVRSHLLSHQPRYPSLLDALAAALSPTDAMMPAMSYVSSKVVRDV
jgi:hypothetical protein